MFNFNSNINKLLHTSDREAHFASTTRIIFKLKWFFIIILFYSLIFYLITDKNDCYFLYKENKLSSTGSHI
jgi:hypothetical protein